MNYSNIHPRNSIANAPSAKKKFEKLSSGNSTSMNIEISYLNIRNSENKAEWIEDSPYNHHEWIICEVIHLVCFFLALYMLYALVHFYTVQQRHRIYSGRSSGSRWLEKMCIMSTVCAIVRFTNNQYLLFTWWHERDHCSVVLNISIALYFVSMYPIYFFLWLRQRIFYSNQALKHLYNKFTRFLSWATIFCFFVLTGVSMVLFVVDRKNSASGRVCGDHYHHHITTNGPVNDTTTANETLSEFTFYNTSKKYHLQGLQVNTIAGLIGGLIQTSFLVLFLYPIMDNKLRAVRNLNMHCHHSLMKLIRRTFLLSGVCIFSDVGIALGVKGIHALFPEAVFAPLAMYDINLVINIVCIVATFRHWRKMLFPWLYNCFGRSLLNNSTRKYYLEHRVSRFTSSNGGGTISSPGDRFNRDSSRRGADEIKLKKAQVVDVLVRNEDGENGETNEKMKIETGNVSDVETEETNGNYIPTRKYRANFSPKTFRPGNINGYKYRRTYSAGESEMPSKTFTMMSGTPIYASSHLSFRSKKAKNVVTTKLVLKSESFLLMDSPTKSNSA
ncbi:uncharacterized protein LOC120347385 [Styela clava]